MTGIAPGLYELPDGDSGTLQSVAMMREMARAAARDPLVRELAHELRRACGARPSAAQCLEQLRAWLRGAVVYTLDNPEYEHTREPREMLEQLAAEGVTYGDCDCISVLAAAVALAMGYTARFVVEGYAGRAEPFAHIYTEAHAPGTFGWAQLDTVRDWLGDPPRPVKSVTVPV